MDIKRITSESEFKAIIDRHNRESEFVVVDLETTGLDLFNDTILEIQIGGFNEDSVYLVAPDIAGYAANLRTRCVGHNLRFDIGFLVRAGIGVSGWQYHDTMLLGSLLDENRESNSLDSWVKDLYQDYYKTQFWEKYKNYHDAPEGERYEYGAKDIIYTGRLYKHLLAALRADGVPYSLLSHVHNLQYSLLKTELEGVRVDIPYLTDLGISLKSQIESLKPKMRSLGQPWVELIELEMWEKAIGKLKSDRGKAGVRRPEFSFDSSSQLIDLLYKKLGLPEQKNAKTRNVSVDFDSLQVVRDSHPLVALIQDYRGLEKVSGTYIDGTLEKMVGDRIYPQFKVNGTKGSRISHNSPNLGQLPKEGGVKGIYIPDEGYLFSDHDYGQLEVCIEAHFTQDKALLSIIRDGASKHDITAKGLGISRDLAKTVNFASQYHCGPEKIAKLLGCSKADGLLAYNKYWETYKGVGEFKKYVNKLLDDGKPIVDLFGRRRRFEHRFYWEGAKERRQAYNFIIQSTGGQIMNNAFYRADAKLRYARTGKGLWTVHDSGLFSHLAKYCEAGCELIDDLMIQEGVLTGLSVPLRVDSVSGLTRWE